MGKLKYDLTGQKFGRILVLKRAENKNRRVTYLCKCDCGKELVILAQNLANGTTKSCGCLKLELVTKRAKNLHRSHGKSKTRLYRIWCAMKCRCFNKNSKRYTDYGGRGITVCDEWKNDFVVFATWANANGYNDTLSIDRIDVDGDYEPSNCRWATVEEQNVNKRHSRYISFKGEKKTITEWAREMHIDRKTLVFRLDTGWPLEKAFTSKDFRYGKGAT